MDNDKIGKLIAELRKKKNLTQKDLASMLNITDRAVSKWERGLCMPDISIICKLADILDISVIELLNGTIDHALKNKNAEVLSTISYAQINIREKLKQISDIAATTIVIFIAFLLLVLNIKNSYYFNKKFVSNTIYIEVEDQKPNFDNNEAIKLIIKNQGKYTDDEYKIVLAFAKELKYNKLFEQYKNSNNKVYTYQDIYKAIYTNRTSLFSTFNVGGIYDVLIKYDKSKVDNLKQFSYNSSTYYNEYNILRAFIHNNYSYYSTITDEIGYHIDNLLKTHYDTSNMVLNDIIEVGDIHE